MKNSSYQISHAFELMDAQLFTLSLREWQVLILLAGDSDHFEISAAMCITTKSVETYITRIGTKLGVRGRNSLSRTARYNRLLLQNSFERLYG